MQQQHYRDNSKQSMHHSASSQNVAGVRMLNSQDADLLLTNFPPTRLSYEVSIHKNDTQTILPGYTCFILPKGRRCIAWATEWKRQRIFAVIEIDGTNSRQERDRDRDRDRNFTNNKDDRPVIRKFHQENGWYPGRVRIFDACFDRTLVYGTVFGGVMFRMNPVGGNNNNICMSSQFFSIHNIYWYKGNQVPSLNSIDHISLCEELFYQNNIRQIAYTNDKSIIFGLPILCNTVRDAEQIIRDLPYEVFALQYRYKSHTRVSQSIIQDRLTVTSSTPHANASVAAQSVTVHHAPAPVPVSAHTPVLSTSRGQPVTKQQFIQPSDDMLTNIQATFIVRPNIQNDIYELFVVSDNYRNPELVFHNFAHIPGFKTSVMMNRLFRNITENERLDTMEESEDEIEFENTEPDKYVTLTKEYKMNCRFNKRFCKWVPIELAMKGDVITSGQAKQHEARYINYRRNK